LGGTAPGGQKGEDRARVRFTGYRVRPLDPDNFAGSVKALLDGCRYAGLIDGDEPWKIILETDQVRVRTFAEEKTVIVLDLPDTEAAGRGAANQPAIAAPSLPINPKHSSAPAASLN
jgi:hypothetical protein